MHVNRPPKTVTFALKTLASAVACAVLLSPAANAAGLGKLTVLSSLGQPLRAEIELTAVSADEASGLSAKLAPADAFRLANIDFNPALLSLRFDVDQRNGRQFIRVSSTQPVNEPFVDMLLELSWTGGRLVREYTFLLDPAELRSTQSAQVAAPVDVPSRTAVPAAAPAASTPSPAALAAAARAQAQAQPQASAAPRAAPAPAPRAAAGDDAKEYHVKPGDTLGRIASRLKPADVSLDMMLVALYRANPEAFVGNNMNRLKSGQILAVPDSDAIKGGAAEGEAHGVVIAHAADFNAYRSKLAGQVSSSTPAKAPESSQSAAGKITAKVEERPTAVTESKDQLKLSKAAGTAAAGKTAVAGEEDKIAREKQVGEANARVKELEKNVADLEKLMAVKNKTMAEKQQAASAPAASAAASAAASVASAPAPAPKPKAKPPVVAPVAQPGVMDIIMDNIQAIGIALAALLGGAGFLLARRRKQEQTASILPKPEISVLGDPGAQAQPLIAETGGQSVDTSNSVFNSNFAPSASQLDTNEVDPVAEADVYIAYGRDAQAEEILKEALRTHPERHAVRLKLMEIFANRKDVRSFEMQASELYALTKGEGEDWAQAALLGQAIDPQNPLYANAGSAAGFGAAAAAGAGAAAGYAAADNAAMDDFASMFAEPPAAEATQAPSAADFSGLDLDLSLDAAPAASPAPADFAAAPQADSNLMDFDLDRDATALPSFDEPAATTPPAPTPASVAAAADADHFLDFDLGGLSFEPVAAAPAPAIEMPAPADDEPVIVAEASAPAADAAVEPFDFAFDLDPPAKAEPAPAQEAAPASLSANDFSMDFGLDLPASAAEPTAAPAAQPDPLAELDMMDFKLPDEPAAPAPAPASAELSMDDFDIPGMAEAAPVPAAAPAAPEFDLSGIDLDLLGSAAAKTPALGDEEMSALHMEMDTKLDLAIAYQEIGDKEGARELLDEVIRGGSDDQVSRASSMRALLG
ncbi:LysM peptidoglycan-binding domain-containing protein [Massilia sp. FT127W]|uniref:LysM peptidoglycan-binding domain-containing protein n=1 Tax=Pseudoduganella aquatica TaxID=2660641 RepID=A0A7X4HDF2_9BURK|nr:LysM peptidoglycan-binding domain-containing protein [Pseudoduganella aquatica]